MLAIAHEQNPGTKDISTTRLLRKMQDTEAIAMGRENHATPREFMRLMAALYTGEGVDPWVSEQTLSVLMKPKTTAINRLLPYQVKVARWMIKNDYFDTEIAKVMCQKPLRLLEEVW